MDTNKTNQEWAAAKVHAVIKRCLTTAAAELIAHATARDQRLEKERKNGR